MVETGVEEGAAEVRLMGTPIAVAARAKPERIRGRRCMKRKGSWIGGGSRSRQPESSIWILSRR
jgi:hypothetical protein